MEQSLAVVLAKNRSLELGDSKTAKIILCSYPGIYYFFIVIHSSLLFPIGWGLRTI